MKLRGVMINNQQVKGLMDIFHIIKILHRAGKSEFLELPQQLLQHWMWPRKKVSIYDFKRERTYNVTIKIRNDKSQKYQLPEQRNIMRSIKYYMYEGLYHDCSGSSHSSRGCKFTYRSRKYDIWKYFPCFT